MSDAALRKPRRWHILVFLAPAVLIYTVIMIVPLVETLWTALERVVDGETRFVGLGNFRILFGDPRWADSFWNALRNNFIFFLIHMMVQNPIGIALAALLSIPKLKGVAIYRTVIFLPADDPLLRHRRLHLEADPLAALGRRAEPSWRHRPEEPVRALSRRRLLGPDHGVAGLGLAICRHSDDAGLCGTPHHPGRDHRSG